MIVPDERVEKALGKLAKTDELAAEFHMKVERAEFKAKAIKDAIFLREEGSVAERQAKAGISDEYKTAMDDYFEALKAYEIIRNERNREILIIDVWRSCSSARTKGIVT